MRVTRGAIARAVRRVTSFLSQQERAGARSRVARAARRVARGSETVIIDYAHAKTVLRNIEFDVAECVDDGSWASTDGSCIWLSPHRPFCASTLFYTVLHEAMHGMVRRARGHELSELAEHRLMALTDRRLV